MGGDAVCGKIMCPPLVTQSKRARCQHGSPKIAGPSKKQRQFRLALLSLLLAGAHALKVTGPAVLALSQMAHHEACQRALGLAGGVPPLVLLCFTSQSPAVLTQVSRAKSSKLELEPRGGGCSVLGDIRGSGRGCIVVSG